MNEEILIPISFFAALFGILYVFLTARNKERMSLIEKGASAELFNRPVKLGKWGLKLGIMAVGVGLGILIANMLTTAGLLVEEVAFPAMIFMFAGAGLIVSYYVAKKDKED